MDIENFDFEESVIYLLGFIKKHNKIINVDFPDFPSSSNFNYKLTQKLIKLARQTNQIICLNEIDIAIESLELEWE